MTQARCRHHHIHLLERILPAAAVPVCIRCGYVDWRQEFDRCGVACDEAPDVQS